MSERRPNILLITADQHNADILGCYGNPVVQTPNIDRLADGVRFTHAFIPFSICSPARTSIMTGQWAHHHGVTYNVSMGREVALIVTTSPRSANRRTS